MKHIKLFENFRSFEDELKEYEIKKYKFNDDGSIDVDGDVYMSSKELDYIPIKFGRVSGNFICTFNKLKSLKWCPYYVGGNFSCTGNKLKDLTDGPEEVGGNYWCDKNNLESLKGLAFEIGRNLVCRDNPNLRQLETLSNITGKILCSRNIDISKFNGDCEEIKNTY